MIRRICGATCLGLAVLLGGGPAQAVIVAQFDAAQFNTNGFPFGDFNNFDAIDATGDVIKINASQDLDGVNGIFGGIGSDVTANFNAASSQLEVTLRVDPTNTATDFRVVLIDIDEPGVSGDEFQFFFDLTGVPTDQFVTLVQPLLVPGPVFSQPAFGLEAGDGIQNFGLGQIQIQSAFGGTNPLVIDVESVKINDTENPVLAELTPATYNAACCSFTFGTFSEAGTFDASGENFIINADSAGGGGPNGGFGFSGINLDFDATLFQLEVEARLLPNNTSGGFNLLLGDNDGDVDGNGIPNQDDFLFFIDTSLLNTEDFTTITIPLGSGSESDVVTSFQSDPGDGLQNFGLFQMQIQASGTGHPGVLGVEITRMSIVEIPAVTPGDFNGDGIVDAADYTV